MNRLLRLALLALVVGAVATSSAQAPRILLLQGFESPFALDPWPPDSPHRAEFSAEWSVEGQRSLKISPHLAVAVDRLATHDVREFQILRLVVNNPSDTTVPVGFSLEDEHHNYWDRHLSAFGAEPGVHVVDVNIAPPLWRSEQNRPFRGAVQEPLDRGCVTRIGFHNQSDDAIYIDRLEAVQPADLSMPGAVAFDFGPPRSPVSAHWQAVTPDQVFTVATGYGFGGPDGFALGQFMAYPTPALGDGVAWPEEGFVVELPGGSYRGWVAFERGGFWGGQTASYTEATLTCNGDTVHHHRYTPSGGHFLFQDTEITDWSQLADRLIWPAHAISSLRFTAREGVNTFRLAVAGTRGVPLRVAALVLAPDTPAGADYLRALQADQRRIVAQTYAQARRGRRHPERQPPGRDLVVEPLLPGEQLYPGDWPVEPAGNLPEEIVAIAGQRATVHLGLYARRDLDLEVETTPPVGAGRLPAPQVSHGRYLPIRPYGTGVAWLEVNHYRPDPFFTCGPELARSLLLEYDVPADAEPGAYRGAVTVAGSGVRAEIPVRLRVLAASLPDIPVPVGLFMNALPMEPDEVASPEVWWRLQESLLAEQGRAGLNCLTGGRGLRYRMVGDGALTGEDAIRYIRLAERFAPIQAVVSYGGFLPALRSDTVDVARMAAAIRHLEEEHDLPPHYVNAYDEPTTAGEMERTLAYLTRSAASGLRTLGYTSWHGDDADWLRLAAATWAPALNGHSGQHLRRLRHEGREPWVYNNGLDRLGMGLRLWRSIQHGAAGRLQWIGLITQGFAFHNLDGREPARCAFLVHDRLGVLVTPMWLAAREGLLDLRLRLALERLAPPGDPVLDLWPLDGYRRDAEAWPPQRLQEVRQRMLVRLGELTGL